MDTAVDRLRTSPNLSLRYSHGLTGVLNLKQPRH